jgi:hypothetical protein
MLRTLSQTLPSLQWIKAATGIYYVKVGKTKKGIRGMIWRFLSDGGIKSRELDSHNIIKLGT